MKHLRYLMILQILMIYCCIGEVSSNENVLKSEVGSESQRISRTSTYKIMVDLSSSLNYTDARFLSVATGNKRVSQVVWNSSQKLQNLASALAPCEFRLGGTSADFLIFNPTDSVQQRVALAAPKKEIENFTITERQWDIFNAFVAKVGWDLKFDVNLFFWRSDGLWNSANAELLLNYSSARGIRIPYFQLGNEPNSYFYKFGFRILPDILVQNFKILKNVLSKYPLYASSKLYGPDVTNIAKHGSARIYFEQFVAAGGHEVVAEYTLHHYYLDGRLATAQDFLNVTILDSLKKLFEIALKIANAGPHPLRIRLTETASCFGGGAVGLSDSFIAGFLWLDKLGLAAQYGATRVFRQTIMGGAYALISSRLDPNPDYYLSLLFKRLVEGPVFNVSLDVFNQNLRVYAHCARPGIYSPGALVIYYLNLDKAQTVLSLAQFKDANLDLYLLTPGDDKGLKSKFVKLNGIKLLMNGSMLPSMPPKPHKGKVTVEAQSFGFIVIPQANVPLCVHYFTNEYSKAESKYFAMFYQISYIFNCAIFACCFFIFERRAFI